MAQTPIHIDGLDELDKKLERLSSDLAKKYIREALKAAGKLIRDEAKSHIKRGSGQLRTVRSAHHEHRQVLKYLDRAIRVFVSKSTGGVLSVRIKPQKAFAYIANFLEFGTAPHLIPKHGVKEIGAMLIGQHYTKQIHHPGAAAKPFLRPAFDAKAERALIVFRDTLAARMGK